MKKQILESEQSRRILGGGVSRARNIGLGMACGEYIYFMDADDYVSPYFLEMAYNLLIKDTADCVCCDFIRADDYSFVFTKPKAPQIRVCTSPFHEFIQKDSLFSHDLWTKIFCKKSIEKLRFSPEIIYGEDLYFNLLAFYDFNKVLFIDEPMYCNVKHQNSITTSDFSEQKAEGFLLICKYLFDKFGQEAFFPLLRKNILNKCLKFVIKKSPFISNNIAEKIAELKKIGAVNYANLPLKMKFNLWNICRKYKK